MRILIASPSLPWPLNSGGNAAQYATLQCLQADHAFTLVVPVYSPTGLQAAAELQTRLPQVKVRAVLCGTPIPSGLRAWSRRLGGGGWRKIRQLLAKPSASSPPALFYPFNPVPVEFVLVLQEELGRHPDICQVEFSELMPLATWLPNSVAKIFIHHQVHFRYAEHFLKVNGSNPYAEYLTAWMRAQELAYLRQYDAVVTFSELERQALAVLPGMPPVFASPFPFADERNKISAGDFAGKFTFVGSGIHHPNHDAIEWLQQEIWPLIRQQLPAAQLVVIGEWDRVAQKKYTGNGIAFSGFVEDLSAALRGSIMLVPLRIGGGIRTKILAALALGIPLVATSIGAEGLLVNDGEELLIRDTAKEFSAAAGRLASEPGCRKKLTETGLATVQKHYSPEQVRRRRNEIYQSLVGRPPAQT